VSLPVEPSNAATDRHAESLSAIGATIDDLVSGPQTDAVVRRDAWEDLGERLPEVGIGLDATLSELQERVMPYGNRLSDPGFIGWITAGPSTAPAAAAAAANMLAPQRYGLSAFNLIEELSLEWLAELCGLGDCMKGVYSSGGSTANLVALGAARQHAFTRAGIDPAADGVDGRPVAVYTSTEAHHTVARSAAVLGLGRHAIRSIAIDENQRMNPDDLERQLNRDLASGVLPVAIVATAGTTNTGAIDPLDEVGRIANDQGVWFHVDGAYGLVGSLDQRIALRYQGLQRADSAIVDPHKWLGAPVGIASTFVRDRAILYDAFTQEPADYLDGAFVAEVDAQSTFESLGIPYSEFGVELSSPSRGIQVWAILKELGVEGVRHRVRTDNDLATHTAQRAIDNPALEALTEPQLSIATFRFTDNRIEDLDAFNHDVLIAVRRESRFIVSSTVVDGRYAIRPCYINPRTTVEHVDEFVDAVVSVGKRMLAG